MTEKKFPFDSVQGRYWAFFTELYETHRYYWYYRERARMIDRCVSIFLSVVSLAGVASWAIWAQHKVGWAVVIAVAQILSAASPHMPFSQQAHTITFLLPELELLIQEVKLKWETICSYEMPSSEIAALTFEYARQLSVIEQKYVSGPDYSVVNSCLKKAEQDRKAYFAANYNIDKED